MPSPDWLGATAGYVAQSGQINQNIATHRSIWTYSGSTVQASETIGNSIYDSTESQYSAQAFTTGAAQTAIGQVLLQISTVGGSAITNTITPLVVSLYASAGGLPTGSVLVSTSITEIGVYSAPFWLPVPLVAAVTPSTVYQVVVSAAGTGSAYYVWQHSNQASGAQTSPDNVTWTQETYGYMFQVFDNSGTLGAIQSMVDDDGARYTQFEYTNGLPTTITEFVETQDGTGTTQVRNLTYSGNNLIGLS